MRAGLDPSRCSRRLAVCTLHPLLGADLTHLLKFRPTWAEQQAASFFQLVPLLCLRFKPALPLTSVLSSFLCPFFLFSSLKLPRFSCLVHSWSPSVLSTTWDILLVVTSDFPRPPAREFLPVSRLLLFPQGDSGLGSGQRLKDIPLDEVPLEVRGPGVALALTALSTWPSSEACTLNTSL